MRTEPSPKSAPTLLVVANLSELMQCSDSCKDLDLEELLDLYLNAGVHIDKRIAPGHAEGQEPLAGEHTPLQCICCLSLTVLFHEI